MQILKADWFENGVRIVLATLCKGIYPVIGWLYTLFMNISKVNILSSEDVKPIYQRVTMIITIIMVFYVTFEFVKYIVQPDGITDKEKGVGNIVYKMIAVVLLIAFVPNIFTWAFKLQTTIIDKGIIGKVIIGQKGTDTDKFGSVFSANIFSMFYYVEDEFAEKKCGEMDCEQLVSLNLSVLSETGKLTYLTKDLNSTTEVETEVEGRKAEIYLIDFTLNGFLAIIVGGLIAYILALYCVDVGVRWAQMIFLQIIAPIPIIGYLSPKKDGIFQKWCKQCITTYLDLFIRIAIMYFMLLICSMLLESRITGKLLEGIETTGMMTTFIYIALILGVMLFAKKAPKMLQELFPSMGAASGNFGLKGGERVPALAARTLGAGLGGVTALARKGIAKAHNTRKRNKEIADRRRSEGKDASRRAVMQEKAEARRNLKAAKSQARKSQRDYRKEQRGTKAERKDLLKAEKALGDAKRNEQKGKGDAEATKAAREKQTAAQDALNRKKAALQAKKELAAAQRSGDTKAETKAREKLDSIEKQGERKTAVESAKTELDKKKAIVEGLDSERAAKETAVSAAAAAYAKAQAGGKKDEIETAKKALDQAIQDRDGTDQIYEQQQRINLKSATIQQNIENYNNAQSALERAQSASAQASDNVKALEAEHDENINAAKAALALASASGNKQQEVIAQEELDRAIVQKNMAISRAEAVENAAKKEEMQAKEDFDAADNKRKENEGLRSDIAQATKTRDELIATRDREYTIAKQEQEAAQTELQAKEKAVSESAKNINTASSAVQKAYSEARNDQREAQDARVSSINNGYRSGIMATIGGAISGAATGVKTGFQAKEIKDVFKKTTEANKQVREQVNQYEKWLDSGGTNVVDRTISKVEQSLGFSTTAQRTEREIKTIDAEVKSLERATAGESAIIQSADKVKDNNLKKMQEGKLTTELSENIPITVGSGETQETFVAHAGERVNEVYGRVQSQVNTAQQELDSIIKAGGTKAEIEAAERKLSNKQQIANQIGKKLHENSFDQMLKAMAEYKNDPTKPDPSTIGAFDPGSVQAAKELLWNIENSRTNPEIVRSMQRILSSKPDVWNAYIGLAPINSQKIYDEIEKALKASSGERAGVISAKKQMSSNLGASDRYAAGQANDSAANSGK